MKNFFRHPQVLLAILVGFLAIVARFWNFQNYLYFITDQGRDALVLKEIVEGNLRLIGPTSGLQGFFLGPLWYYLGVPGYVLSGGNPYGISLWYVALASLAVPGFYWMSRQLFPKSPVWQLTLFAVLAFIPGSISGSTFIWNPLISIPLLVGVILSLWHARTSRLWLAAGFFLLGCLLQSEFAYAIFLVPVLFTLIFWIRQKWSVVDYLLAVVAGGVTLAPQVLFDLRNQFLMTNALLKGIGSDQVGWLTLIKTRPLQLIDATVGLLAGLNPASYVWGVSLLGFLLIGIWYIKIHKAKLVSANTYYRWQILALIAVTPYLGFLVWRSNHGNFFEYYLTPHFIVLLPLIFLGIQQLPVFLKGVKARIPLTIDQSVVTGFQIAAVVITLTFSWFHYGAVIAYPDNQAGLRSIDETVEAVLAWQVYDQQFAAAQGNGFPQSSIITFTPNFSTAQYDFVTDWKVRQGRYQLPHTQVRPNDDIVYLLIEPDREIPDKRFVPWYEKATSDRMLVRKQQIGVLTAETWMTPAYVEASGISAYQPSIQELRHW